MALGQVFASSQVFLFYRRVLSVNLCEVWFVCYIAICSTKINLFEHLCSSHNRSLAFVISRRRLEGAGPREHGVAHFETTKNMPVKIFNLKNLTNWNFIVPRGIRNNLGQKWYEKIMFLWKTFKKLRWNQKIIIYSFENFHFLILSFAWIFNRFVYRLCITEHQNFSSLPAKIFWSIWFLNNKSSQHCLLSTRMIKRRLLWPTFFDDRQFRSCQLCADKQGGFKIKCSSKNSAATDPVAELHFLLLSVNFIRVFVLVYPRFHSLFIFFTQYSLGGKSIYQYSVYT